MPDFPFGSRPHLQQRGARCIACKGRYERRHDMNNIIRRCLSQRSWHQDLSRWPSNVMSSSDRPGRERLLAEPPWLRARPDARPPVDPMDPPRPESRACKAAENNRRSSPPRDGVSGMPTLGCREATSLDALDPRHIRPWLMLVADSEMGTGPDALMRSCLGAVAASWTLAVVAASVPALLLGCSADWRSLSGVGFAIWSKKPLVVMGMPAWIVDVRGEPDPVGSDALETSWSRDICRGAGPEADCSPWDCPTRLPTIERD